MPPSNLFRAMPALRSSMTGLTATARQPSRLGVNMITRRANSTITEDQQQSQDQTPPTAAFSSTTEPPSPTAPLADAAPAVTETKNVLPPSLRTYPYTLRKGVVSTVGKMDRTVRVDHRHRILDKHIGKLYPHVTTFLVADPNNSLREGDVIEFASGYPKSRRVHHVVERIIAPFETPIEARPPVLSRTERDALRAEKRMAKWQRREERRAESGAWAKQEHVGRVRKLLLEREPAQ